MKYLALLRGINVGGKNKVAMSELKIWLTEAGFGKVQTYINSGNIIFETPESDKNQAAQKVEKVIEERTKLKISVLVKTLAELETIHQALPENWVNNAEMKSDVLFLFDGTDKPEILGQIEQNPAVDTLIYTSGAVLWNVLRQNYGKSKMNKIIGTKVYAQATVRNANTVRKLYGLMR